MNIFLTTHKTGTTADFSMQATTGNIVSVEYILTDEDGNLLDSNTGFAPLEYLHGGGNIIAGLEQSLEGSKVNDQLQITLQPEQGDGHYNPELLYRLPVADYSDSGFTNIGDTIQLPDGGEAVIIKVDKKNLIADANHPLAGKALCYDVTIKSVRKATPEEITAGGPLSAVASDCCSGLPGCC